MGSFHFEYFFHFLLVLLLKSISLSCEKFIIKTYIFIYSQFDLTGEPTLYDRRTWAENNPSIFLIFQRDLRLFPRPRLCAPTNMYETNSTNEVNVTSYFNTSYKRTTYILVSATHFWFQRSSGKCCPS